LDTHLSEALSHDVDVVDVEEDKLGVGVGVLRLVAAALGQVGEGVDLGPRVVDVDSVGLGVGVHDAGDELLVLSAPLTGHAHQRLRAPRDRRQASQTTRYSECVVPEGLWCRPNDEA